MLARHTVVVSIDRLHRGFVGAYGNAAVETPALDDLACRATVFDRFYVDTLDHCATLQRLTASLPDVDCAELVTDDERLATLLRDTFQTTHVHQARFADEPATESDATYTARFFEDVASVAVRLRKHDSSFLWCHYGGLGLCWDAPLTWRTRYGDGDDPAPYSGVIPPPMQHVTRGIDDDAIQSVHAAYAANVTLVDEWLGGFFDFFNFCDSLDTLLVVVATRGIPLGQHGLLGIVDDETNRDLASHIWSETIHVPLIVRWPNQTSARRTNKLASTDDLAKLWRLDDQKLFASNRSRVAIASGEVEAIVTDDWFLRIEDATTQLFAKPADRWEVNNVADRCADVVEMLTQESSSDSA
ncbi:MAG: sulfatase-like hydrolase/transferase [Thermoguttaceae bacterium]